MRPFDDIDGRGVRVVRGPWRGHAGQIDYQSALTPTGLRVHVSLDVSGDGVELWLSDVEFQDPAPLTLGDALFDDVSARPRFEPLALRWGVYDHAEGTLREITPGQTVTDRLTEAEARAAQLNEDGQ